MTLEIPYRLANGVGNFPTADKWNADHDWLTALIFGNALVNGGFENWTGATSFSSPANGAVLTEGWLWTTSGTSPATVTFSRESTTIDTGIYSAKINITGAGSANSLLGPQQTVRAVTSLRGLTMLFGARVYASTASKVRLKINDGSSTSYSSYHTGSGSWELLQVSMAINAAASSITVTIEVTSDFTGIVYADSAYLYNVPVSIQSPAKAALSYSEMLSPKTIGRIVQKQVASTTTQATSTSGSYADTGLSATITLRDSRNWVLVFVMQSVGATTAGTATTLRIRRDATDLALPGDLFGCYNNCGTEMEIVVPLFFPDAPGSVGPLTYKTRFSRYTGAGTATVQSNVAANTGNGSFIMLLEVEAQ